MHLSYLTSRQNLALIVNLYVLCYECNVLISVLWIQVGSGYTRKELYEFNDKLKPHFQIYNPRKPPAWLELLSGRQRPEIVIEPSKSYILQVSSVWYLVPNSIAKFDGLEWEGYFLVVYGSCIALIIVEMTQLKQI